MGQPGKPGQGPPPGRPAFGAGPGGPLGLNLTDDQKAKLADLRKDFEAKMAKILTPEQKGQMEKARQQWQPRRPEGKPQPKAEKKPEVKAEKKS
jgi:Spy/CpxP family protein refolding chaperone